MGAPGINCKPRICKLCGQEFKPKSTHQSCCGREIQVPCVVCGTLFTKKCTTSDNKKTCSEECNLKYQQMRREENARKQKKICKWCGKEFYASHAKVVYCDRTHYKKCAVCGKYFEFDPKTQLETQTCSKDCFVKLQLSHRDIEAEKEKQKQVLLEKYGVDNSAKIPGFRDKLKQSCLDKYGVEFYTQTDEYKERVKKTSIETYGVEHWLSSPEVIAKREKTCLERYGSSNVLSSDHGQEKIAKFYEENGIINSSQLHIVDLETWNQFKNDPVTYLESLHPKGLTVLELAHELGVSTGAIYEVIDSDTKNKYILKDFSKMETAVSILLKDLVPDVNIHHNVRKYIYPYEIDICLPDYTLGIECDPSCTHNASNVDPWDNASHDSNYHSMKTELAESVGIHLIHIFGYEWIHRNSAVVALLKELIHPELDFSEEFEIVESIDTSMCDNFLDTYCIHGVQPYDYNICCTRKSDKSIVAIMTFEKLESEKWILVDRCGCGILSCSIYEHLIKKFIDTHGPKFIAYNMDRAHYLDAFCKNLRFRYVGVSEPKYVWVNATTEICMSKDEWAAYTDSELLSRRFVQVFDAGSSIWEYHSEDMKKKEVLDKITS